MDNTSLLDTPVEYEDGRPASLILLLLILIATGGAIGGMTNAVNGFVSPRYFLTILRWDPVDVWHKAILQGLLEGLIYGVLMGVVFTIGFTLLTRRRGTWALAKRQVRRMVVIIIGCWVLVGVIAILLAFTFPEFYDRAFIGVPAAGAERAGYAWVGGSIWGGIGGGVLAVIVGLVGIARHR